MSRSFLPLIAFLPALLVACSGDDSQPTSTPQPTATSVSVAPSSPAATPSLEPTAASPSPSPAAGAPSPTVAPAQPASTATPAPTPATCPVSPTPRPDFPIVTSGVQTDGVTTALRTEVAATIANRQYGLMYHPEMGDDEAMLFIYAVPPRSGHWMANTCLPLDIAYLDANGRVMQIVQGQPFDRSVLSPAAPYSYVLEVNVGWFARYGHGVGSQVIIPPGLPEPAR